MDRSNLTVREGHRSRDRTSLGGADGAPAPSRAFFDDLSRHGGRVALIGEAGPVTYSALAGEADRFAQQWGAKRSLIFLEAANCTSSIAAYLGCLAGRHPVYLFSPSDWPKLPGLIERYRPNAVFRCRDGRLEEHARSQDILDLHPDLRVLLSTSGSTGSPKLVKLSDTNLVSNAASIAAYLGLNVEERAMTSLPFNYSYGMSVVNSHLSSGASLVLTDLSVADTRFWERFRSCHATSFAGVPYTFELLSRVSFPWADAPGLRYATPAGGRPAADLVRHFAGLGERHGWRFYVMYGQTEASPRMAYLPPDRAAAFPGCIGVAIPGGAFELLDEDGVTLVDGVDRPGELAYRGPNVMMGYASDVGGLATCEAPEKLLTGDIACRNALGLYYVVGRRARFIKPFGIRLNLDEMQSHLRQWAPGAVCTGSDERIVLGIPKADRIGDVDGVVKRLADYSKLPAFLFATVEVDEIPLLSSGKPDYVRLSEMAATDPAAGADRRREGPVPGPVRFLRQFLQETARILGLVRDEWESVSHIFSTLMGAERIGGRSTFADLAGDSLHFVQVQLALESYLGDLPANWEHLSVDELERLKADGLVL